MPRAGSKEDYDNSKGGDFGLLPEDSYVFEILSVKDNGEVPDNFNPDQTVRDVRIFVRPVQYADDPETPIVDANTGNEINPDKSIMIFFKEKFGWSNSGIPSKDRKLVCATLGIPVNSDIDFDYPDLIGGRFIGDVLHKTSSKNGRPVKYDNIVDYRPIKANRERPRPRPAESAVAAAQEAFDLTEDDDDLPF